MKNKSIRNPIRSKRIKMLRKMNSKMKIMLKISKNSPTFLLPMIPYILLLPIRKMDLIKRIIIQDKARKKNYSMSHILIHIFLHNRCLPKNSLIEIFKMMIAKNSQIFWEIPRIQKIIILVIKIQIVNTLGTKTQIIII